MKPNRSTGSWTSRTSTRDSLVEPDPHGCLVMVLSIGLGIALMLCLSILACFGDEGVPVLPGLLFVISTTVLLSVSHLQGQVNRALWLRNSRVRGDLSRTNVFVEVLRFPAIAGFLAAATWGAVQTEFYPLWVGGAAGLLAVSSALYLGWQIFAELRSGRGALELEKIPLHPGETATASFRPGRVVPPGADFVVQLRYVEETYRTNPFHTGTDPHLTVCFERGASLRWVGHEMEVSFAIPTEAADRGAFTDTRARPPRYWELSIEGQGLESLFILPVEPAPKAGFRADC